MNSLPLALLEYLCPGYPKPSTDGFRMRYRFEGSWASLRSHTEAIRALPALVCMSTCVGATPDVIEFECVRLN